MPDLKKILTDEERVSLMVAFRKSMGIASRPMSISFSKHYNAESKQWLLNKGIDHDITITFDQEDL